MLGSDFGRVKPLFVNVDTNRYSVSESHIGHTMDVYQYMDKIDIYYAARLAASHARIIGV